MRISGGRTVKSAKESKKKSTSKSKTDKNSQKNTGKDEEIIAERMNIPATAQVSVEQIMSNQASLGEYKTAREIFRESGVKRNKERPDRQNLLSGPALPGNRFPLPKDGALEEDTPQIAAQTLGTSFNAINGPAETGAFPPDTEGEVGPTQIVVHVNGRIRTFNKTTGAADGFLNADTDVFFASSTTPPGAGQITFTTDPNVRYDRLSNRWFLNIIDATLNSTTGATVVPNRVIIAVSDAASNGNITASTVWTFYQFQGDATLFTDYQSFGLDASAMYIGGNMFTLAGAFNSTKGFVIPKAPTLTGSPLTVWAFSGLVATGTGAGPFSPRGVDNPDPANTGPTALGYFIGVDNATFNTLMIRRVTNPGSTAAAPTISANLSLAVPSTQFPVKVPHLGNTGGNNGRLDALDDRLYSAMIRNGRLWTAHNISVNNTGTTTGTRTRNAARWYEIQNLGTTPALVQSGTLYDNTAPNDVNQRNYWIPTIAVSGQGHAAMGTSIAGTNERINAFTTGRLVGDTLGTMREGPGGAALPGFTASSTAYNPASDPGGTGGRRWGDYSATVVDPLDDMTMWTIQEYNNGTNTYGVRVVKLIAPPPPTLPASISVPQGQPAAIVVVTGTQVNGSGFFDPGANLAAPALPFQHLTADITPSLRSPESPSGSITSVTYNSPTQVTLVLNTVGTTAGPRTLTITNPDGQQVSTTLNVTIAPTAANASISGRVLDSNGRGISSVSVTATGENGNVLTAVSNSFGFYAFNGLPTGQTYVLSVSNRRYNFATSSQVVNLSENVSDLNFVAGK